MRMPHWIQTARYDVRVVFERDPAAQSVVEVLLAYPGLHALWGYRFAHWLWMHDRKLLGRWVSHVVRWLTGIEIHPGARIGPGLFIDHGMGVVIGETAEVGRDVTLYHGVTLGGVSTEKGKRHPTLGDRVVVGAGAKVLGAITVGEGSRIGANAAVVRSVPPGSVAVGVPAHAARSERPSGEVDLHHDRLPDAVEKAIAALTRRVDGLERQLKREREQRAAPESALDGGRAEPAVPAGETRRDEVLDYQI